ncbi:hypothetical protein ALC57_13280, partial [Trachymyrmex cornetzi]
GVEACIGLSYRALGRFLLGFGSSSSPEKIVSIMIGSLEESAVFSTICFSGSIIDLKCLLNCAINALPFELHIAEYQFWGPGTRLEKLLARGDRGINPLDAACREHDIAYLLSNDLTERHAADSILAEKARKRIISSDSTLAAGVAKAVNDSKAAQRQLEELQRHNRVMEGRGVYLAPYKSGRGVARRKKKRR